MIPATICSYDCLRTSACSWLGRVSNPDAAVCQPAAASHCARASDQGFGRIRTPLPTEAKAQLPKSFQVGPRHPGAATRMQGSRVVLKRAQASSAKSTTVALQNEASLERSRMLGFTRSRIPACSLKKGATAQPGSTVAIGRFGMS